MKTEMRYVSAAAGGADLEVRMEPAAGATPAKIVGYAAVYNSLSQDLGGFRELVMPGAFDLALSRGGDVRAMYNHERILGRTGKRGNPGTLRLSSDAKGLRYEIDVPDTSTGRDVAESIRRGDVDGSSFCFRVIGTDGEHWRKDDAGQPLRELRKLELLDVGPVDSPAYLATEAGVRSLPDESKRQMTGLLVPAELKLGTPNLRLAQIRMKELGLNSKLETGNSKRFYVESEELACAMADGCRQAASACDSLVSLSWKMEGYEDARLAAVDCLTLCSALAGIAPDSGILSDLAGIASTALRACAKACKGLDHPIPKLCAAVCIQTADQCEVIAGT